MRYWYRVDWNDIKTTRVSLSGWIFGKTEGEARAHARNRASEYQSQAIREELTTARIYLQEHPVTEFNY